VNMRTLKGASTGVLLGSCTLFLVVLFLDWHRSKIDVAGVVHVQAQDSGWAGWGLLAGAAAATLVVLGLYRMRRGGGPTATFGIVDLILAVTMLSATVSTVFGGGADVTAPAVGIEANAILWPGWVGLGLAVVTLISAVLVALPEVWQPGHRPTPTTA